MGLQRERRGGESGNRIQVEKVMAFQECMDVDKWTMYGSPRFEVL